MNLEYQKFRHYDGITFYGLSDNVNSFVYFVNLTNKNVFIDSFNITVNESNTLSKIILYKHVSSVPNNVEELYCFNAYGNAVLDMGLFSQSTFSTAYSSTYMLSTLLNSTTEINIKTLIKPQKSMQLKLIKVDCSIAVNFYALGN